MASWLADGGPLQPQERPAASNDEGAPAAAGPCQRTVGGGKILRAPTGTAQGRRAACRARGADSTRQRIAAPHAARAAGPS